MENLQLAESLYRLISVSDDDILREECHAQKDCQLGPVLYRLLQDNKDARIFPYVCCVAASAIYHNPYSRRKLYEEAIEWLTKANADEYKIALVQKRLDWCIKMTTIQNLAEERIVHPDALCKIKGIEYFDETQLNFHDAYVEKLIRVEQDFRSDIELELKPTWTDYSFKFKLNNVIDFSLNCSSNFVELYWVSFYLYNGYLVCDMEGFGTISCHDAEIVKAEKLAELIRQKAQK